jgi:hypothetical protein
VRVSKDEATERAVMLRDASQRFETVTFISNHVLGHGRACPGHPRLHLKLQKTWMPATSAGMTAGSKKSVHPSEQGALVSRREKPNGGGEY